MFGEYRTGHNIWPEESFEQIATEAKIGLVRGAEKFGPDFDIPYVRMNAIGRSGEFYPDLVLRTNVTKNELEEYSLKQGDFLFNTRNSKELVGKTVLFREQGEHVYNNNLMRIRFRQDIEPEYVAAAFLTPYIQNELEIRKAGTTNVFAIYARELKSLPMPIPPHELQKVFSNRAKTIENMKSQQRLALVFLDSLFASIQYRAFRGEL
jgi:type I restriction enzyme S subunit